MVLLSSFWLNLAVAIVLLTLIVRLILLKPALAGTKMQKEMTDMQPKMKEIQEKYKDDPQKLSEETMKLFRQQGSGPLKWCLMLLVQIPVFIWLFFVIRDFAEKEWAINIDYLYSFLHFLPLEWVQREDINSVMFGMDLLTSGDVLIVILACVFLFLQMQLVLMNRPATPQNMPGAENMPDIGQMMKYMNIFLVWFMAIFVYTMPSGIGLYIATTTLFSLIQYSIQYREVLKAKFRALQSKLMGGNK